MQSIFIGGWQKSVESKLAVSLARPFGKNDISKKNT